MKRVAVITYHKAYNCGAMLQAWALRVFLESLGCAVIFPNCNHVGVSPRWSMDGLGRFHGLRKIRHFVWLLVWNLCSIGWLDYTRHCYRRFARRELKGPKCTPGELPELCDAVVIGSDQVWHPLISGVDTPLFLAESIPTSLPAVSYAASFGDKVPAEDAMARLVRALPRFRTVSVREELAARELGERGVRSEIVLDPTFLPGSEAYRPLIGKRTIKDRYLFVYAVSLSDFVLCTARTLAKRNGLKLVICGVYVKSPFRAPPECDWGVSPEKMVTLIAYADMVLASSFHGTAFSLILSKPFLSLRDTVDSRPTRVSTLLDQLSLSDRIVNPSVSIEEMDVTLNRSVDWRTVHEKLAELRKGSVRFLTEALGL